jgi:hypothetical protein
VLLHAPLPKMGKPRGCCAGGAQDFDAVGAAFKVLDPGNRGQVDTRVLAMLMKSLPGVQQVGFRACRWTSGGQPHPSGDHPAAGDLSPVQAFGGTREQQRQLGRPELVAAQGNASILNVRKSTTMPICKWW